MEHLQYQGFEYTMVPSQNRIEFFKDLTVIGDNIKVKIIYELIKSVLAVGDKNILIETSIEQRVYKFSVTYQSYALGTFFYLPMESRMDIYVPESYNFPFVQFKKKKVVHKSYNALLDRLGLDRLFERFIKVL